MMTLAYEDSVSRNDIRYSGATSFVVIGFFTPNYYPLAQTFSKNLTQHSITHHLYARANAAGNWGHQTLQKPSVLMNARVDYPNSTLILMDVDCQVRGDISSIANCVGDIVLPMGRKPMKNGTALKPGTRVVLIKPTAQSDAFLALWEEMCHLTTYPFETDEIRLQRAIENGAGRFAIATLPRPLAGIEIRKATPHDLILHDSARDDSRFMGSVRKDLKQKFQKLRNTIYRLTTGRDYTSKKHI